MRLESGTYSYIQLKHVSSMNYLQNYTGTDPHGSGMGGGVVDGVRGHCNRVPAGHVSPVWLPYQSTRFASRLSTELSDLFRMPNSKHVIDFIYSILFSGTKHIREERKTEADREREERKNNDKRPLKEKLLDFPKALLVLVCKKYNVKLT